MSHCDKCESKDVFWALMEKSGKKNLLDKVPVADGNIVIMSVSGIERTARAIKEDEREELAEHGAHFHTSHFVTCPRRQPKQKKGPRTRAVAKSQPGQLSEEQGGAAAPGESAATEPETE